VIKFLLNLSFWFTYRLDPIYRSGNGIFSPPFEDDIFPLLGYAKILLTDPTLFSVAFPLLHSFYPFNFSFTFIFCLSSFFFANFLPQVTSAYIPLPGRGWGEESADVILGEKDEQVEEQKEEM
jgi:hypothetical protein